MQDKTSPVIDHIDNIYDERHGSLRLNKYDKEIFEYADTEANARAKMLIYLIENNLINLNERK